MILSVYYDEQEIGSLQLNGEGFISFRYDEVWCNSDNSFPISQSLPLSGNYKKGISDHRFFTNLLPEAAARSAVCRRLGISIDNDFALLAAIGGECAGALQIIKKQSDVRLTSKSEYQKNIK